MTEIFRGKHVLVTGGTGSFGNYIIPKLLETNIRKITVFSRDEEKQLDLQRKIQDNRLNYVIGDVRDKEAILDAADDADIVYHAAALKIIPFMENFPLESVKTNLLGSLNVREACIKNSVEKALLISTDKAVKPVNVYGMCKALAEKIWVTPHKGHCVISAVRYGNVLGSRGSVVPFFKELVTKKSPLPITSKDMTRFWLTLDQAVKLVFKATEYMKGGEIFVPKCPASKIYPDLVDAIAEDYPCKVIGIRPGEKIHETLINEEEMLRTEFDEKAGCYIIKLYGMPCRNSLKMEFTSSNAEQLCSDELRSLLREAGLIQ